MISGMKHEILRNVDDKLWTKRVFFNVLISKWVRPLNVWTSK